MWDMNFGDCNDMWLEDSPLVPPPQTPPPDKNIVFERLPGRSKEFVEMLRQRKTVMIQPFKNSDDLEYLIKALDFVRNYE